MKLYIHAGCHKTGTTAFQYFCSHYSSQILKYKIYYPKHSSHQHSYLAHDVLNGEFTSTSKVIQEAKLLKVDTLLLSGEDFENCLVDINFAKRVEAIAQKEGIEEITWIFVVRDAFDYFESLYAELSIHGIINNYSDMANSILNHGYFSATNSVYNYIFAFDHNHFLNEFRKNITTHVETLTFKAFTHSFPGASILSWFIPRDHIDEMIRNFPPNKANNNARLSELEVELQYIYNFFGYSEENVNSLKKLIFAHFAKLRLRRKANMRNHLKAEFEKVFTLDLSKVHTRSN